MIHQDTAQFESDIGHGKQAPRSRCGPIERFGRRILRHRTGVEVGDADRVLDGDVEPFIEAWLTQQLGEGSAPGPESVD